VDRVVFFFIRIELGQVLPFPLLSFLGNLYYLFDDMSSRKELSGCAKRNKRKDRDALLESQRGAIHKFLRNGSSSRNPNSLQLALVTVEEQPTENVDGVMTSMRLIIILMSMKTFLIRNI
jgi:hypothetical protein